MTIRPSERGASLPPRRRAGPRGGADPGARMGAGHTAPSAGIYYPGRGVGGGDGSAVGGDGARPGRRGGRAPRAVAGSRTAPPASPVVVGVTASRRDGDVAFPGRSRRRPRTPARQGRGAQRGRARCAGPALCRWSDLEGISGRWSRGPDLVVAAFSERTVAASGCEGGGTHELTFSAAAWTYRSRSPGQRYLSARAAPRASPSPRLRGAAIDAVAGPSGAELALPLRHRATGRDLAGFAHRGRQLAELVLAAGPLATNARGNRLPLLGVVAAFGGVVGAAPNGTHGAGGRRRGPADDLGAGRSEAGGRTSRWADDRRAKLVVIPARRPRATGSVGGALLVLLAANATQLDTRPGRGSEGVPSGCAVAPAAGAAPCAAVAVLLCPYDLREHDDAR